MILKTFKEYILLARDVEIGPLTENPSPLYDNGPNFSSFRTRGEMPGIWIQVAGHQAYLGASYEAALLTAQLSDWWIPSRDGELLIDDMEWFETRATLGENWAQQELRMFREERRTRLAHNIQLATTDERNPDQEK